MARGSGVRDRIRNLFLGKLGEVITRQQIIEASKDPITGEEPENWHQRLSELRTDEGYTIWASRDMERAHVVRREFHTSTTDRIDRACMKAAIFARFAPLAPVASAFKNHFPSLWSWSYALTSHLTHSVNPNLDPQDATQWQALCGRHQVTKKNYWDNATGKLNVYAIIQGASANEKREAFHFLLEYFGYKLLESGKIVKNEK